MKAYRILLPLLALLGLAVSCIDFGGTLPGGYINTSFQCNEDQNCSVVFPQTKCENGRCVCPATLTTCPQNCLNNANASPDTCKCIDTNVDRNHCGKCDNACSGTTSECCSGSCADLYSDVKNCGACGKACADGEACCNGTCTKIKDQANNCGGCNVRCGGSETCCGLACVETKSDNNNCGACGNKCGDGKSCCEGKCIDTNVDLSNCGSCGRACTGNADTCCAGDCINTKSDTANCGACGTTCTAGQSCCSGSCQSTSDNISHCGGCGITCSGSFKPATPSITKEQSTKAELLTFVFDNLQPPNSTDEVKLKVSVYGAYGPPKAAAAIALSVSNKAKPLGIINGSAPDCNPRATDAHSGTFSLPRGSIVNGKLTVNVKLSDAVDNSRCSSVYDPTTGAYYKSRVVMELSYGNESCCEGACVALADNSDNCGTCGTACSDGGSCCQGNCCQNGEVCCGDKCCPSGLSCCDGQCCNNIDNSTSLLNDSISFVLLDETNKAFYAISEDNKISKWDISTPGLPKLSGPATIAPPNSANTNPITLMSAALHPDGAYIAIGTRNNVQIWSTNINKNTKPTYVLGNQITGFSGSTKAIAFHPTDKNIMITGGDDKRLYFWDLSNFTTRPKLLAINPTNGHTKTITAIAIADGTVPTLATGGDDGQVIFWRYQYPRQAPILGQKIKIINELKPPPPGFDPNADIPVVAMVFSAQSKLLAVSCGDRVLRFYNNDPTAQGPGGMKIPLGAKRWTFPSGSLAAGLSFSSDNKYFGAAYLDGRLLLWKVNTSVSTFVQKEVITFNHPDEVRSLSLTKSGSNGNAYVISGSRDKNIRLYPVTPQQFPKP